MKFLTTLCMAALAAALFRMLIPENKLSKQLAALVGAVFILTGISAISGADFFISDTSSVQAEELNARAVISTNEELERQICAEMSDKIYVFLAQREIYPSEIRVSVNISGLYSIDITQVELVFLENQGGEQAAATAAAELLRGELPPETEIGIEIKTEVE